MSFQKFAYKKGFDELLSNLRNEAEIIDRNKIINSIKYLLNIFKVERLLK